MCIRSIVGIMEGGYGTRVRLADALMPGQVARAECMEIWNLFPPLGFLLLCRMDAWREGMIIFGMIEISGLITGCISLVRECDISQHHSSCYIHSRSHTINNTHLKKSLFVQTISRLLTTARCRAACSLGLLLFALWEKDRLQQGPARGHSIVVTSREALAPQSHSQTTLLLSWCCWS